MSIFLAIETSTELASVALLLDGQILSRSSADVLTHSQSVLPMVQQLLAEAGIAIQRCDALAFGCGPGSFTGVRTACGIVQGLAFGAALPVIPVSTLMAMALACREGGAGNDIVTMLDARMDEVYWAQYRHEGAWQEIVGPTLSAAALVRPVGDAGLLAACGNGLALLDRVHDTDPALRPLSPFAHVDPGIMPHAIQVARLAALAYARGETLDARDAQPVYLRNRVALTTVERAQAQANRTSQEAALKAMVVQ